MKDDFINVTEYGAPRAERRFGRRINAEFLDRYLETDKLCAKKFGVAVGGVGEYISGLERYVRAVGGDEVLRRLRNYRNIRNRFAHEVGAIKWDNVVSKDDVKWLRCFNKKLVKRRDPISVYLRGEQMCALRGRIFGALLVAALIAVAALSVALYFVIKNR